MWLQNGKPELSNKEVSSDNKVALIYARTPAAIKQQIALVYGPHEEISKKTKYPRKFKRTK